MPHSLDPQYYTKTISSTGAKPFVLSAKVHPDDLVPTQSRFYDDAFLPDNDIPARLVRHKLIKGSAFQHNRPMYALRVIDIARGIFLSKLDYINFIKIYHINLIGDPEPFPTEYLTLREEDLSLIYPSGKRVQVTMDAAPQATPIRLLRGEWVYTLTCKLRVLPGYDEQEEL